MSWSLAPKRTGAERSGCRLASIRRLAEAHLLPGSRVGPYTTAGFAQGAQAALSMLRRHTRRHASAQKGPPLCSRSPATPATALRSPTCRITDLRCSDVTRRTQATHPTDSSRPAFAASAHCTHPPAAKWTHPCGLPFCSRGRCGCGTAGGRAECVVVIVVLPAAAAAAVEERPAAGAVDELAIVRKTSARVREEHETRRRQRVGTM